MLAIQENEIISSKKVSIRYDEPTQTYYCFYNRSDNSGIELILSYDVQENKWIVESTEYKSILEVQINELFNEENIPFEEQIPFVIEYLDTYFGNE